jgi:SAM-dependent methyltransferase
LIRAVFSGNQFGTVMPWIKIVIRPVQIKKEIYLQFSYFDKTKNITKNFTKTEAQDKLEELLDMSFKNIHIQTNTKTLNLQFTKKGRLIVQTKQSSMALIAPSIIHDNAKQKILSGDSAIPFLKAIGILTSEGKIKANMQRKYSQINEFLRIFTEIDFLRVFPDKHVPVVDFGCGNAYLTFATYYYLTYILELEAHVVGIDIKIDLLETHRHKVNDLGWSNLSFEEGGISSYHNEQPLDIVIALHACDTASDDALAQGIIADSKMIVLAPCCQHYLQEELSKAPFPQPILAINRDGILKERLGDILTDTFRATILRIFGYHTDVIQFVSTEHTAKNLMIRAFKINDFSVPNLSAYDEYKALKSFWGVTPFLEHLLSNEMEQLLVK